MAEVALPVMVGLQLVGTGLSVASDVKSAKAAKKTAGFEAGLLEQQASDTELIGQESANRSRSASRQLSGAQRVAEAAQGIDISSGSAADVIANDARLGEIDAQTILNNAAREALGLRKQAELVRMGGKNTAQSYTNRAYGTLLSGASQLYSIYDAYGRNSVPRADQSRSVGAEIRGYYR